MEDLLKELHILKDKYKRLEVEALDNFDETMFYGKWSATKHIITLVEGIIIKSNGKKMEEKT